jgi:hypothetical protein
LDFDAMNYPGSSQRRSHMRAIFFATVMSIGFVAVPASADPADNPAGDPFERDDMESQPDPSGDGDASDPSKG